MAGASLSAVAAFDTLCDLTESRPAVMIEASYNPAQVSPEKVVQATFGLEVGMTAILGIGGALIFDSADRRLKIVPPLKQQSDTL